MSETTTPQKQTLGVSHPEYVKMFVGGVLGLPSSCCRTRSGHRA
jgi:hypothetical protein